MALATRPRCRAAFSTRDAYPAVRDWYQMQAADGHSLHAPTSLSFVRVLPRLEQVTKVEPRAILDPR